MFELIRRNLIRQLRHFYTKPSQKNDVSSLAPECSLIARASLLLAQRNINSKTVGIIFSMDRAMQLHALLGSYRDHVVKGPRLTVIYRVTSDDHEKAYDAVFHEFADLIELAVRQATRESFRELLIGALNSTDAKNVFFLVDDNMFIEPVDIQIFASHATTYCVPTLRLGENLNRSYTVQKSQMKPPLLKLDAAEAQHAASSDLMLWCWNGGVLDWGYPLSVDGHILQREEILAMAGAIEFNSPNTFEGNLQLFNTAYQWRTGVCYKKSRLINIPYNKVQTDIENLHGEVHQDYMLEKWNEGFRIDRCAYYGVDNESAHQEMPLKLFKAGEQ